MRTSRPFGWTATSMPPRWPLPALACISCIAPYQGYGSDPDITRCLDTRVFYVCPRANPDGAEWALADRPRLVRSSTRPYPFRGTAARRNDRPRTSTATDASLMMRIPDPNGPWKVCSQEPRLLVRREPAETGGQYYRLLPEGGLEDYDGVTIRIQPRKERLTSTAISRMAGARNESRRAQAPTLPQSPRCATPWTSSHRT